jgi:hypothetical protein
LSCDGLIVHKETTAACVEDFGNRGFRGGCDMNKSVMLKEEVERRGKKIRITKGMGKRRWL